MRILLTGASGFTGKHLLSLLKKKDDEVFCLVRTKKGLPNEIFWDFRTEFPGNVPECDVVVHLAAYVYFGADLVPEQYEVNTVATLRLAQYARKHNAYFILASMTGIHGMAQRIDRSTPVGPANHYAMSKFLAEEILRNCLKDYSILRIGGIYGLDGPDHLRLNTAITEALRFNRNPLLKGPGQAKRNYICGQDVARWIDHLIRTSAQRRGEHKDTLYLAGPEIMSIEDYLNTVVQVLLPLGKIERQEGAPGTDSVVTASPAPFKMHAFTDYLRSLKGDPNG